MPLYEYQCEACGNRYELIRKFSDPPLETCVKCGVAGQVHKLVSSPAFQFKGSGWYITDYAKKSGDSAAGKSETKSGAGSDAKADTKPDSPKESSAPAADKPAASAPAATTSSKDK
jgi:putative FmdB family regulatory protein